MTGRPVLSVVLITRNGALTIAEQLAALATQQWDRTWEVVIVDNGSTDETPRIIESFVCLHPSWRAIVATERASAGYARNVGVQAAQGTYVAFVDDDDVVGDGWLAALGDQVMQSQYVGARLELERLNDAITRGARQPAQQTGIDRFCGVGVSAAPLVAVRRDWVLTVGGFDENIWPEDTDLALRLFARFGLEPTFVPEAVYHYRLRTNPRTVRQQAYRYGKVRPLLLRRWRSILEPPRRRSQTAALEWIRLFATAVAARRDPIRRLAWHRRMGTRLGHAAGSLQYRCYWP